MRDAKISTDDDVLKALERMKKVLALVVLISSLPQPPAPATTKAKSDRKLYTVHRVFGMEVFYQVEYATHPGKRFLTRDTTMDRPELAWLQPGLKRIWSKFWANRSRRYDSYCCWCWVSFTTDGNGWRNRSRR